MVDRSRRRSVEQSPVFTVSTDGRATEDPEGPYSLRHSEPIFVPNLRYSIPVLHEKERDETRVTTNERRKERYVDRERGRKRGREGER